MWLRFFKIILGTTAVHTKDLCQLHNTGSWGEGVLDLSAYGDTSNTLKFEVTTDGSLNSNLFLDDISFSDTDSTLASVNIPAEMGLDLVGRTR